MPPPTPNHPKLKPLLLLTLTLIQSICLAEAQKAPPFAEEHALHSRLQITPSGYKTPEEAAKATLPPLKAMAKANPQAIAMMLPENVLANLDKNYAAYSKEWTDTFVVPKSDTNEILYVRPEGIYVVKIDDTMPTLNSPVGTLAQANLELEMGKPPSRFLNLSYIRSEGGVDSNAQVGKWAKKTYKKVTPTLDNSEENQKLVTEAILAQIRGLKFSIDQVDESPEAKKVTIKREDRVKQVIAALEASKLVKNPTLREQVSKAIEELKRELKKPSVRSTH